MLLSGCFSILYRYFSQIPKLFLCTNLDRSCTNLDTTTTYMIGKVQVHTVVKFEPIVLPESLDKVCLNQ
jgi:hypothetical protein